ncbi:uncharacterized protein LOC128249494 [Octopus bimaculoides]|uniref:Uncharacterized protein n=1 Tax=Octopus bimaculoides TaxID=37653 RepID=A0A0L8FKS7_OCTBM|nr:uncharacterized protein LOC128249494 [Octopus bimaculoides]
MFVGKREDPMFVGKREDPMFVGKREDPMFVGKREEDSLFVGKREHVTELLSKGGFSETQFGNRLSQYVNGKSKYNPGLVSKRKLRLMNLVTHNKNSLKGDQQVSNDKRELESVTINKPIFRRKEDESSADKISRLRSNFFHGIKRYSGPSFVSKTIKYPLVDSERNRYTLLSAKRDEDPLFVGKRIVGRNYLIANRKFAAKRRQKFKRTAAKPSNTISLHKRNFSHTMLVKRYLGIQDPSSLVIELPNAHNPSNSVKPSKKLSKKSLHMPLNVLYALPMKSDSFNNFKDTNRTDYGEQISLGSSKTDLTSKVISRRSSSQPSSNKFKEGKINAVRVNKGKIENPYEKHADTLSHSGDAIENSQRLMSSTAKEDNHGDKTDLRDVEIPVR